jgi:hypothetical protein
LILLLTFGSISNEVDFAFVSLCVSFSVVSLLLKKDFFQHIPGHIIKIKKDILIPKSKSFI